MRTYFENGAREYDEKIKEMDKIYSKVVKKFPEIKKKEITLKYQAPVCYAELRLIDPIEYFVWHKLIKYPVIAAGCMFFEVNRGEREAIIAHELGHYKRHKKSNINKIKKHINMFQEVGIYKLIETGTNPNHKMKRMIKCLTMHELYADQEAIKAGYSKSLLSFLERILNRHEDELSRLQREELRLRIKNLKTNNIQMF